MDNWYREDLENENRSLKREVAAYRSAIILVLAELIHQFGMDSEAFTKVTAAIKEYWPKN